MSSPVEYFAAFSCPHWPFGNPDSISWLLDTLSNLSPRPRTIIHLGDNFNADAASVHSLREDHDLEEEYATGSEFLSQVRLAVPHRCKYVWLLGNHEDNILREDARRISKNLRTLLHWNRIEPYCLEFRRWTQLPYIKAAKGIYQIGQVAFIHGWDSGINSDELESLQVAANILGGRSHRLVVRGHTHTPVPVTQCLRTRTCPLPFWFANVGTLGPLQPIYMTRKSAFRWGPALLYGCATPRPNYNSPSCQWDVEVLTPKGPL